MVRPIISSDLDILRRPVNWLVDATVPLSIVSAVWVVCLFVFSSLPSSAICWCASFLLVVINFVSLLCQVILAGRIPKLLVVTQLMLFCVLNYQMFSTFGAGNYAIASPVGFWDWAFFTIVYLLRVVDAVDFVEAYAEAYGLTLLRIAPLSFGSRLLLLFMNVMAGVFLVAWLIQFIRRWLRERISPTTFWATVLRKLRWCAIFVFLVSYPAYSYIHQWSLADSLWWWPIENFARTIDIPDMFHVFRGCWIFEHHWYSINASVASATLAVTYRLVVGAFTGECIYRLYLKYTRGIGVSVDQLVETIVSDNDEVARNTAANALMEYGPAGRSAIRSLLFEVAKGSQRDTTTIVPILNAIDEGWQTSKEALSVSEVAVHQATSTDRSTFVIGVTALARIREFGVEVSPSQLIHLNCVAAVNCACGTINSILRLDDAELGRWSEALEVVEACVFADEAWELLPPPGHAYGLAFELIRNVRVLITKLSNGYGRRALSCSRAFDSARAQLARVVCMLNSMDPGWTERPDVQDAISAVERRLRDESRAVKKDAARTLRLLNEMRVVPLDRSLDTIRKIEGNDRPSAVRRQSSPVTAIVVVVLCLLVLVMIGKFVIKKNPSGSLTDPAPPTNTNDKSSDPDKGLPDGLLKAIERDEVRNKLAVEITKCTMVANGRVECDLGQLRKIVRENPELTHELISLWCVNTSALGENGRDMIQMAYFLATAYDAEFPNARKVDYVRDEAHAQRISNWLDGLNERIR